MLASLASVSISVTNVLAVETSERVMHRALMTRCPRLLRRRGAHRRAPFPNRFCIRTRQGESCQSVLKVHRHNPWHIGRRRPHRDILSCSSRLRSRAPDLRVRNDP